MNKSFCHYNNHRLTIEIHIADQFHLSRDLIRNACNANIDYACTWFDHVGRNQTRHTSGRYDNVSIQTELFQLGRRCEAMTHGNCCVHRARIIASIGMQKHKNRKSYILRTANYDRILAKRIDVRTLQKLLHTQCGARYQCVHVQAQTSDIFLIETVDVFGTTDCVTYKAFVNMLWYWQLHKYAVDSVVSI